MGKKYIVEIGRLERLYKAFVNGNGKPNMTWLSPEVDLTPYTESDTEQVRNEAYQRGLNDAWEAVKKMTLCEEDGGLDAVAYGEIFGYGKSFSTVLKTFSASEAIEGIRQYEQKKEEQIQVGDEVKNTQTDARFIVTHMWVNNHGEKGVSGFNYECSAFSTALDLVRKTGRHFPEIVKVLAKMREESNG